MNYLNKLKRIHERVNRQKMNEIELYELVAGDRSMVVADVIDPIVNLTAINFYGAVGVFCSYSLHARSLVNRKGREHIATQIDGSDGFTHPCYGW